MSQEPNKKPENGLCERSTRHLRDAPDLVSDRATTADMMAFLSAMSRGLAPFDAAREGGRPLSFWRALARKDPDFRAAYEAAREDFGHAMAAEMLAKADQADTKSKAGVSKARLQADVRMRLARAYARETFGDKVDVTKKTVDVRRTEFVSFFGVRVHKQEEAGDEQVARVLGEGDAQEVGGWLEADARGAGREGAHEEGVAPGQEGLQADEPGAEGEREAGDPGRGQGRVDSELA